MLELNRLYNLDCMQGMREFPDGFFDLAIVDPPYGIGIDGQRKRVCRNPKHNRKEHSREGWDSKPPTECAEICFLPDWKESKGAKYEFGEAIAQNKPFFFFEDWEVKQNAEK